MAREIEAGAPVVIVKGERVLNSGFAGMRGTYVGPSRVARGDVPRVLVRFEGFTDSVPFYPEEVLAADVVGDTDETERLTERLTNEPPAGTRTLRGRRV